MHDPFTPSAQGPPQTLSYATPGAHGIFVAPRKRAKASIILFAASCFLCAISLPSYYMQVLLLRSGADGIPITPDQADANDMRVALLTLVEVACSLAAFIVMLTWLYRIFKNLKLTRVSMSYGPGWAIGGWFVPFLNLVRPYQVYREAWELCVHPIAGVGLVGTWWTLWIVSFILGRIANAVAEHAGQGPTAIESLINATYFSMGESGAQLVSQVLWILIIRRIQQGQEQMTFEVPVARAAA